MQREQSKLHFQLLSVGLRTLSHKLESRVLDRFHFGPQDLVRHQVHIFNIFNIIPHILYQLKIAASLNQAFDLIQFCRISEHQQLKQNDNQDQDQVRLGSLTNQVEEGGRIQQTRFLSGSGGARSHTVHIIGRID